MENIIRYLKAQGYNCVSSDYYNLINDWKRWYEGLVPSFHNW